jgi:hypothetical protein
MPATLLRAQLTDKELTLRTQARAEARRALPNPAATARALALAICEVEAGLRSASQLERICHPSLWDAIAHRIQRAGGPPVSGSSVLRVQVQEFTAGAGGCGRGGPPRPASGGHGVAAGGRAQPLGADRAPLLARMLETGGASRARDSPRRLSTTHRLGLAPAGTGR